MRLLAPTLALAGLVACGSSASDAPTPPGGRDDLVVVPGTHVWMVPPDGMTPARNAAGFTSADGRDSITLIELDQPYREVSTGFLLPSNLKKQGIEVQGREDRSNGDAKGVLLDVLQQGQPAVIWMFGQQSTVIVQGTSPDAARLERVREAVLSAVWDETIEVDWTEGLSFTLGDTGNLEPWQRLGTLVCFTESGTGKGTPQGEPMFTVGPIPATPVSDRLAFHRRRLQQLPLDEIQETGTEEVEVDALPGYASVVLARDPSNGQPRAALQMLLFEPDRQWLAIGICHADRGEAVLPMFERMAKSLERQRTP